MLKRLLRSLFRLDPHRAAYRAAVARRARRLFGGVPAVRTGQGDSQVDWEV